MGKYLSDAYIIVYFGMVRFYNSHFNHRANFYRSIFRTITDFSGILLVNYKSGFHPREKSPISIYMIGTTSVIGVGIYFDVCIM